MNQPRSICSREAKDKSVLEGYVGPQVLVGDQEYSRQNVLREIERSFHHVDRS